MKKWLLAVMLASGVYAVFSGEFFIERKGVILASVKEGLSGENETDYLRERNRELEIELLNLKKNNPKPSLDGRMVEAKVYSIYPFGNRSEITINVGADKGVASGQAVVLDNSLIGRIKEVKARTSVVQTIFDPGFQIPVRIGKGEIDALYVGGMSPKLDLIDAKESIDCGELIVAAADNFAYGLGMGYAAQIKEGTLKEATIEPLLEIKDIRNVFVVLD